MFGYVHPDRAELKLREDGFYQAVYCGLCKTMGRRYGFPARLTLSYDVTFLALLRLAADGTPPVTEKRRCFVHPLRRSRQLAAHPQLDYAADAAMLLVYYKWCDTLADSRGVKRLAAKCLSPWMNRHHRMAAAMRPALDAVFADATAKQQQLESAGETSIDAAAEPTAIMTAAMLGDLAADETERRIYDRVGYCLGRWIYLVDAVDDLAEDQKHGNYNPFLCTENADADRLGALNACTADCAASYALLSGKRYGGLIGNVFERGMPAVSKAVVSGNYQKKRRNRDEGPV